MNQLHKRTHKWAFPLGVLLVALAIVGAVSLVKLAVGGIQEARENPADKARYEAFLSNIIVHDPDPFDDPSKVQENVSQLLDICIWSILQSEQNRPEEYVMDEDNNLLIPQAQVAAEYKALFGIEPPTYVTVESGDFDFVYDPDQQVYKVPVGGELEIYAPRVKDVKKTGNQVELTVDYITDGDFQLDERGRKVPTEPAKTMIITLLEQEDGSLQVGSIRQPVGMDYVNGQTMVG